MAAETPEMITIHSEGRYHRLTRLHIVSKAYLPTREFMALGQVALRPDRVPPFMPDLPHAEQLPVYCFGLN